MDIRQAITIVERQGAGPEYFYHVSAKANLASIRKHGLVANHQGRAAGGNYDEGQWESLQGIYMTDEIKLVANMIDNREDLEDWLIVIIEATHADMLPDEDIIDIVLGKALENIGSPEDWYDEDQNGPTVTKLARFLADASGDHDTDLCRRMAWNWLCVHHEGDEAGEENWTDLKQEFIDRHRTIRVPGDDRAHSVRHPGHIGFDGHPRIVAIAAPTSQGTLKVAGKAALPAGVMGALEAFARNLDLDMDRPLSAAEKAAKAAEKKKKSNADTQLKALHDEAIELSRRCFPHRGFAQTKDILDRMSPELIRSNIDRMRAMLGAPKK